MTPPLPPQLFMTPPRGVGITSGQVIKKYQPVCQKFNQIKEGLRNDGKIYR